MIFHKSLFYCIFDQINEALMSIRELQKSVWNSIRVTKC